MTDKPKCRAAVLLGRRNKGKTKNPENISDAVRAFRCKQLARVRWHGGRKPKKEANHE